MPLGKQDVLNVLGDPLVSQIDFWLQGLHIHSGAYAQVAAAIRSDRIHIISGDNPRWAFYYPVAGTYTRQNGTVQQIAANTLVTQNAASLDPIEAALLLHECTHAYVDLSRAVATTDLSGEAAAYIAQVILVMLSWPGTRPRRNGTRIGRMFHGVGDLIVQFSLHRPTGRGRHLQWRDYSFLRGLIHHIQQYHRIGLNELVTADGV